MGFATFQELPQHNISVPQFHAPAAPTPPVYNTQAMIAPLLHMAEYFSPDARARRKAAVAKANEEIRNSAPGGLNDQIKSLKFLSLRNNQRKLDLESRNLDRLERNINEVHKSGKYAPRPEQIKAQQQVIEPDLTKPSAGPNIADPESIDDESISPMIDDGQTEQA